MKRLSPQAQSYDLDIIIFNEVVLRLTWLRLAALTTNINIINPDLRIAGSFFNSEQKYDAHAHSSYKDITSIRPGSCYILDVALQVKGFVQARPKGCLHTLPFTSLEYQKYDKPKLSSGGKAGEEQQVEILRIRFDVRLMNGYAIHIVVMLYQALQCLCADCLKNQQMGKLPLYHIMLCLGSKAQPYKPRKTGIKPLTLNISV